MYYIDDPKSTVDVEAKWRARSIFEQISWLFFQLWVDFVVGNACKMMREYDRVFG